MRSVMLVVATLAGLLGTGCSGDKGKELFETAQFEEKQNNREHAEQLYLEIIAKFPDTPTATQARGRLDAIRARR